MIDEVLQSKCGSEGFVEKDESRCFCWEDLERFQKIARGLEDGETLEALGARLGLESPRMIKLRLGRLERAVGLSAKGLVERCKYERSARLSAEGRQLLKYADRLSEMKGEIQNLFAEPPCPLLRMATNLPALFLLAPEVFQELIEWDRSEGGNGQLRFRPEYQSIEDYSEAMKRVADGQADLAVFCRTPVDRGTPLLKNLELEVLLTTEVSVLVAKPHKFITRNVKTLTLKDLAREHIVARPLYRFLFPTNEPKGGWTPVIHSADVHAYLRKGIGVGLNTQFGFRLISEVENPPKDANDEIVEIPLSTSSKVDICLIRPAEERRWREIGSETEMFLDALRAFYGRKRQELKEVGELSDAV